MDFELQPSNRKDKKWVAIFDNKRVHFGARHASDYTIHKDDARLIRYLKRHWKRENWGDITTPGALSRWLLWNRPSLADAIKDTERRFKIKIKFNQ